MGERPKIEKISEPVASEYKGFPVLKIPVNIGQDGLGFPMAFGLAKAKAIIEHIEFIKTFVAQNDKEDGQ